MSQPVSIKWNLQNYGLFETTKWLGRSAFYHGWLRLTPQGRREQKFDQLNNVDTEGYLSNQELGLPSDSIHYAPTRPRRFRSIMRKLRIDAAKFTFIDVGCGKGRALVMAHSMGFNRLIGVELSSYLGSIAIRNTCSFSNAEIHVCDATKFELPPSDSVVFMYNPFWEPTMGRFIVNLVQSLSACPRKLYLVYVNPFCEAAINRHQLLKAIYRVKNYYTIYESVVSSTVLDLSPSDKLPARYRAATAG